MAKPSDWCTVNTHSWRPPRKAVSHAEPRKFGPSSDTHTPDSAITGCLNDYTGGASHFICNGSRRRPLGKHALGSSVYQELSLPPRINQPQARVYYTLVIAAQ